MMKSLVDHPYLLAMKLRASPHILTIRAWNYIYYNTIEDFNSIVQAVKSFHNMTL
ncbi:MAG: hypothetical protein K2X77_31405 [Candidatus Obscuribacterales bacterium]|nr:hypothetical protein [Candidatus Obscuribacterales bacterium]